MRWAGLGRKANVPLMKRSDTIIGWLLAAAWMSVGPLWLAAVLLMPTPSAMGALYHIPAACRALAAQQGVKAIRSRADAESVIQKLDQNIAWPGVRKCRDAVKREWGM